MQILVRAEEQTSVAVHDVSEEDYERFKGILGAEDQDYDTFRCLSISVGEVTFQLFLTKKEKENG